LRRCDRRHARALIRVTSRRPLSGYTGPPPTGSSHDRLDDPGEEPRGRPARESETGGKSRRGSNSSGFAPREGADRIVAGSSGPSARTRWSPADLGTRRRRLETQVPHGSTSRRIPSLSLGRALPEPLRWPIWSQTQR
jgi:hypothetical protein